jgi:hypothetical protein
MFNPDVPNLPLILPPTDIDLSQTTDYAIGQSSRTPSPNEVREALQELVSGLQQATAATFELEEEKIKTIADNTNVALNDLDRRLDATTNNHYDLEQVVHSFLVLYLVGDKMPEDVSKHHQTVIEAFLKSKSQVN